MLEEHLLIKITIMIILMMFQRIFHPINKIERKTYQLINKANKKAEIVEAEIIQLELFPHRDWEELISLTI
jgi:hypothetical protein